MNRQLIYVVVAIVAAISAITAFHWLINVKVPTFFFVAYVCLIILTLLFSYASLEMALDETRDKYF